MEDAKRLGYAVTMFERRRAMTELKSSNFNTRAFGERVAMNMPIQGTAADIIKLAMVKVSQILKERRLKTKLILQVHDELIFDVPKAEVEEVVALVHDCMEHVARTVRPAGCGCKNRTQLVRDKMTQQQTSYRKIGLTGGIGSGKSLAVKRFAELGARVYHADEFARRALDPGSPCYDRAVSEFGNGILNPDGTINRKRLADIVFASDEKREKLNSIVHPYVIDALFTQAQRDYEETQHPIAIFEVPLLFESGMDAQMDKTILVYSDQENAHPPRHGTGRAHARAGFIQDTRADAGGRKTPPRGLCIGKQRHRGRSDFSG